MARCERNKPNNGGIVVYKRHRFKNRQCDSCGQKQTNIYPKTKRHVKGISQ